MCYIVGTDHPKGVTMESFLNKVEREANEEVKRIHREAQQIVDVLTTLKLEIPQELRRLLPWVEVEPVSLPVTSEVVEVDEKKLTADGTKARVAKMKAKAEAEYQQTRAEIYGVLRKGPKLTDEVMREIPRNEHRIRTAGSRMKKDGELDFRKKGFQGPVEWFLTERPVSLEQLRDEVVDRKGGDIPFEETLVKLGFQNQEHLGQMLDELVRQGIILVTKDGNYANYESSPSSDIRTLHEKKKFTGGNGVAGTGRSKVTSDHDVQAMLNKVKAQGAKVRLTDGGHIQIEHGGKSIIVGKTPSRSGILQDKNRVKSVLGLNV